MVKIFLVSVGSDRFPLVYTFVGGITAFKSWFELLIRSQQEQKAKGIIIPEEFKSRYSKFPETLTYTLIHEYPAKTKISVMNKFVNKKTAELRKDFLNRKTSGLISYIQMTPLFQSHRFLTPNTSQNP